MTGTSYAVIAALPVVAWCLYTLVQRWRNKFHYIPSHYPKSLLWGHLQVIGDGYKTLDNPARHPDYIFENLWRNKGCPQMLFMDLRPVNYATVVVCSHDIAEQISKASPLYPYSVTKSPTVQAGLHNLIGPFSILTAEDESWKGLRKRFNAGFAPQHLFSLTPVIVEKTTIFMNKLDALAKSGTEFEFEPMCTNITFDIIGKVIMNLDFKAQDDDTGGDDIVRHFRSLIKTFDAGSYWLGLNISLRIRRWIASKQTDKAIKKSIEEQFSQLGDAQNSTSEKKRDRSVLALALKDTEVLTPEILQTTADQVKTFLFAGHDTTSILLQWLTYTLTIYPECLAKMRAEHEAVFGGKDPRDVILAHPEETIKAMPYTSACMKEALRLYPPAGTARFAWGTGFKVRTEDGGEVCLDNTVLYPCHYIIQRDPRVYGDTAGHFVPERWTGDVDTSSARKDEDVASKSESKIPVSAWRPFERGPRNCIGQELANIEARVILACIIRRYDFIKVGAGELELDQKNQPILGDNGRYKTKSPLFNAMVVTAKPFDKCRMRVKLHNPSSR